VRERHTIDASPAQTREPGSGSVNREGGGSVHPTQGGGLRALSGMAGWATGAKGSTR
jgi:hypothetical protein